MKSRKSQIPTALALVLASALPIASHAAPVDLTGQGWVTYGDANSYALGIPGAPAVQSGTGQIDLYTKLGLQSNGALSNGTAGMDDAFDTPSANNVEGFRMDSGNEPGGLQAGGWDRNGWWDSTLSALDSKLDFSKTSMVFFFANNETGNTPDLAAWARLELTDLAGNLVVLSGITGRFDITNDPTHQGNVGYGPPDGTIPAPGGVGGGVPMGDPANFTSNGAEPFVSDFIDSGNDICTIGTALVPCSLPGAIHHSENLGANNAAYAIVLPELDKLINDLVTGGADLSLYALHVQYRLGCGPELTQAGGGFPTNTNGSCADNYALNGGAEKVFIGSQFLPTTPPNYCQEHPTDPICTTVPEPNVLALFGLGLLGLGLARRRVAR
jgi:hypothetical protein